MTRVEIEKMVRSIIKKLRTIYPDTEWEDLEAQAWLIVTEKIDGYNKKSGASLSTYLYTQVDGELRHYIERVILRGQYMQGNRIHMKSLPDIGATDGATEAHIMLEQMVSLGTGIQRDVLLCMIGGKTPTETAKELKVSRQRVNAILQDIRERYR